MIPHKKNHSQPENGFHGFTFSSQGIIALVLIFISCSNPLFANDKQYVLENQALKITFAESSQGFDCLSIENKLAGNKRFIQPDPGKAKKWPGLWQIVFQKPSKDKEKYETICLANNKCGGKSTADLIQSASGQKLILQWRGISLNGEQDCLDIEAIINLDKGDAPSVWQININNRSNQWGLWSVNYPFLRTVCPKGTADVLIPGDEMSTAHGGKLYRNSTKTFEGVYPSGYCSFQFMAFNQGNSGLYIGAHDSEALTKKLTITDDQHVTFETLA